MDTARLHTDIQAAVLRTHADLAHAVLAHPDVSPIVSRLRSAGVTLWQILAVLMPYILALMAGRPVDWAALIAALLALKSGQAEDPSPPPPAAGKK